MTARILVVDDIPANVKLLEARLIAEYFDVLTADNGRDALDICDRTQVDVILLDIMMPDMDGFEVCERLKANPRTAHIPVVMVTALDQPSDRVRGLKAGADDFLTKPVNDLQLISRVKSLVRLKTLSDELRIRADTAQSIGIDDPLRLNDGRLEEAAQVLLVDSRGSSQERIIKTLKPIALVTAMSDPQAAVFDAAENAYDLVIVNGNLDDYDPLRLCSQLRSLERTRIIPILLITELGDEQMIVRALDLGVNDYIVRPLDPNELVARTLTQIRRKRFNDRLRHSVTQTIELAVTDGLTGLHNRRYLDSHLKMLFTSGAWQAALGLHHRYRPLQAGQRYLWSRCRRRGVEGVRHANPLDRAWCRPGLPLRGGRVRRGDAGYLTGRRGPCRRAAAGHHRVETVPVERNGHGAGDHGVHGHCDCQPRSRYAGAVVEAGRSGALPGETRRPQPRGRRCGLKRGVAK